jgi:UV DNA damage repair endonuclease
MDKVERSLWDNDNVRAHLANLGHKISQLRFRISTHPGQFTVLSSDRDEVIENSIAELNNQGWLFDAMGLDRSVQFPINIHGGKSNRADRLVESINRLNESARSRLTLENDESSYSVRELLPISQKTKVPIVFDSHHHTFRPQGMGGKEAAEESMLTWPTNITPIQHLSNTDPMNVNGSFTQRRQHSYDLHYIPDFQLEILNSGLVDVEMEFKGKNLVVLPNLARVGISYENQNCID